MPLKLTDDIARAEAPPPSGNKVIRDSEVRGLGLRITAAGARVWTFEYEFTGKNRRYTIGDLSTFPIGKARKLALDLKAKVRLGEDPQAQRNEARALAVAPKAKTFADIVEDFLASLQKKDRADRYVVETGRNFTNHVLPRWGNKALSDIARKDVIATLDDIAENGTVRLVEGKKIRAAGGPIAANRVLAAIRALFNFAIRKGLVEVNPCTLVERPGHEVERDRTLAKDELLELWPVFETAGYPFGYFFRLCLVTGQRRAEVAGMRWADLDLEARTWTIPAKLNKSGRVHVVPLSAMAMAIIESAPRRSYVESGAKKPSPYVLTSDGDVPISGFSRAKAMVEAKVLEARRELDPKAEAMADWGAHDLRRTCATEMGRLGVAELVISRVLNHVAAGVTAKHYNHYEYLTEKRHALDTWAGYLDRLLKPVDNVVALAAGGKR